ncbi:MAG: DMT family transporter [Paracoccaceae bacterium]
MANLKGILYALLAFAIFATHDVIIKILGGSYSPFQLIFFSVLLSFPLVTLLLIRDATPGHLRPVHPWWIALRTLAGVATGVSAFYAFSVLPLAQTYTILFAAPLLITLLAIPILGEKVRLRRWIAVIVGLIGVLVVLNPGNTELGLGHLAALVAASGSALASIIIRKVGRDERSVVLLLYPMVANFVVMACIMPFYYVPMPIEDLGLVGVISVLGFVAGLTLIAAYKNGEAAIVAPMQYSQIIWASIFGYLIFGETLGRETLIGASIIIASGLYIVFRESTSSASENTPVLRTRSRHETGTTFRISPFVARILPKK